MSALELYSKAEAQIGDALPFMMGFAVPALLFVFKGAWKNAATTQATTQAYITQILKDIGLLEAARDRAKEKDEEQAELIKALQNEMRELRDKVVVLDHEAKK